MQNFKCNRLCTLICHSSSDWCVQMTQTQHIHKSLVIVLTQSHNYTQSRKHTRIWPDWAAIVNSARRSPRYVCFPPLPTINCQYRCRCRRHSTRAHHARPSASAAQTHTLTHAVENTRVAVAIATDKCVRRSSIQIIYYDFNPALWDGLWFCYIFLTGGWIWWSLWMCACVSSFFKSWLRSAEFLMGFGSLNKIIKPRIYQKLFY